MIRLLLACLLPSLLFAQWTPEVLWDHSGETTQSHYGSHVFALGDQNGDGFADWGVVSQGAAGFDSVYARVDLYHGGNPPNSVPYRSFTGGPGLENTWGQATGDVNGDGDIDWMLLKRYWPYSQQYTIEYYWGGPTSDALPDLVMHFPRTTLINGMGDFNGDGFDDLYAYNYLADYGRIFLGSAVPDTVYDWQLISPPDNPYLADAEAFGHINHDAFMDILSWNNTGGLNIFLGGPNPDTLPTLHVPGVGASIKNIVNDLNGDGADEIIIPLIEDLNLYLGGDSLSSTPDVILNFTGCDFTPDNFSLGDVNDDGFNDFAAVDRDCANGWGKLSLYLGYLWLNSNPVLEIYGRTLPLNLVGIRTVCGLGDVNGDGVDDFAVGATNDDNDGTRGRVVVISGNPDIHVGADDPPYIAQDFRAQVYPNPFNSTTVIRYALPRASHISLKVFDVTGREVAVLVDRVGAAGEQRVAWDARAVASGVYFVWLAAGERAMTRKVLLVR